MSDISVQSAATESPYVEAGSPSKFDPVDTGEAPSGGGVFEHSGKTNYDPVENPFVNEAAADDRSKSAEAADKSLTNPVDNSQLPSEEVDAGTAGSQVGQIGDAISEAIADLLKTSPAG